MTRNNINTALENIAKDEGLCVRTKYFPPRDIRINPCNLKLFADNPDNLQDKRDVDYCIGKQLSDEIVVPRICIDVSISLNLGSVKKFSADAKIFKDMHPYLRYGILVYGRANLEKDFLNAPLGRIDFVEAIGGIIEYPDKLEAQLNVLVKEQLAICDNLLNIIYGNGVIHSVKKYLIS